MVTKIPHQPSIAASIAGLFRFWNKNEKFLN
jgi:hypothetical protein